MAPSELAQWRENFTGEVPPLTLSEKQEFLSTLDGVSLASDAFFPFRDSLDCAAPKGVKYVVAAGGSVGEVLRDGAASEAATAPVAAAAAVAASSSVRAVCCWNAQRELT